MPIVGVSASADGELFASIAEDESAKVFDVVNFGASEVLFLCHSCGLTLPHANAHARAPPRYDQYGQARFHAKILLLGTSERPSTEHSCHVCPFFFVRACCLLMIRQLGTELRYYSTIRWPWGRQTIGDGGDAPSVPGSLNDRTSATLVTSKATII